MGARSMPSYRCAAIGAIAHNADSRPSALALIEPDGKTFSYNELWQQIEAVSERLQGAGVVTGERVAVLLPQGALQILAVAGVLNHHIAVPLQAKTTAAEVEASLRRLSAAALIVSQEFPAEADAANKAGLVVLVARNGQSPRDWEVRVPAFPSNPPAVRSEAILLLITSATTDRSKVVPLTGANLDAGNAATRDAAGLVDSDRLLLMVSLCHRIGVESAFAQFLAGGAVIATAGYDPNSYLHWLKSLKPTWYVCSPAVHQASLAPLKVTLPTSPLSLRLLQSAGAPLPNSLRDELEQALGVPVLNGYGATEAHYIAIEGVPFNGHIPDAAGRSCGLEIRILNSSKEFLPTGEEGEIAVRGPAVFSGYEDDAEANRNAFQDGWFRTGDLGRLDQDGNLFVTGRLKEMINRGGEKILPGEVDAAFASHPSVLEAVAFAVPHPTLGEDVACAIVLREGDKGKVNAQELRRYAAEGLASFKVPHSIYFVDEIPRGELGKPQRWMLAERLSGKSAATQTPAEITEQLTADPFVLLLQEIWARILDRDDLSLDENFFEAGGDSLATITMLAEVDQRHGSQTSAAAGSFADEPTLAHLANLVRDTLPERPPAGDGSRNMQLFPVRTGVSDARLFCIPPDGVEGLGLRRLARQLHGEMDLVIARPVDTRYNRSLFTFERYGVESAALIRQMQPNGPYIVGGWCFGGTVAVETARQLAHQGQDARVILFDVPMPGAPGLLRQWRSFLEEVKQQAYRLFTSEHPGLKQNVRALTRRVFWSWMIPFRQILLPVEHVPFVQKIIQWGQDEYFPYYKARRVDVPVLHILSTIESVEIHSDPRLCWRSIARGGIEEQRLTLDNWNFFHESNLPAIADALIKWCSIQGEAAPCQDDPAPEVEATGARH